jgi:hypothetical protein
MLKSPGVVRTQVAILDERGCVEAGAAVSPLIVGTTCAFCTCGLLTLRELSLASSYIRWKVLPYPYDLIYRERHKTA